MVSEICPERYGASSPFRKSERVSPTENLLPPPLCTACDQKLIEILTGTAPDCGTTAQWDFYCSEVVCNKSKTERKGGGQQGGTVARFIMNIYQNVHQNVIFQCHIRSSKGFRRRFCRNQKDFVRIWHQSWEGQLWPHPVQLGLIF